MIEVSKQISKHNQEHIKKYENNNDTKQNNNMKDSQWIKRFEYAKRLNRPKQYSKNEVDVMGGLSELEKIQNKIII